MARWPGCLNACAMGSRALAATRCAISSIATAPGTPTEPTVDWAAPEPAPTPQAQEPLTSTAPDSDDDGYSELDRRREEIELRRNRTGTKEIY